MRRVIQKTITTTKIVSLTITHSETEEAVEYTLAASADQLEAVEAAQSSEATSDVAAEAQLDPAHDEIVDAVNDGGDQDESAS